MIANHGWHAPTGAKNISDCCRIRTWAGSFELGEIPNPLTFCNLTSLQTGSKYDGKHLHRKTTGTSCNEFLEPYLSPGGSECFQLPFCGWRVVVG